MPPKNIQNLPELYVQQPDGKIMKLGKISEAQIFDDASPDIDILEEPRYMFPERTATFEVKWNPTVDTLYLLIHGRLPYNNWRKMHGFPLRRKCRK